MKQNGEPSSAVDPGKPLVSREILLVEDHAETARGMQAVAERAFPGCRVHWASTLAGAREVIATRRDLDLALVDLALPDGSGLDVLAHLRQEQPKTLCVVTTIYDDDGHIFPALAAGAEGYLLKGEEPDSLVRHLQSIAQGVPPLSPRVARRMLAHFRQPEANSVSAPATPRKAPAPTVGVALTPRETEVLSLIARGLQRSEVAGLLGVSENTVAKFLKDIYRKLNISSRAEAALEASRRGLL